MMIIMMILLRLQRLLFLSHVDIGLQDPGELIVAALAVGAAVPWFAAVACFPRRSGNPWAA